MTGLIISYEHTTFTKSFWNVGEASVSKQTPGHTGVEGHTIAVTKAQVGNDLCQEICLNLAPPLLGFACAVEQNFMTAFTSDGT